VDAGKAIRLALAALTALLLLGVIAASAAPFFNVNIVATEWKPLYCPDALIAFFAPAACALLLLSGNKALAQFLKEYGGILAPMFLAAVLLVFIQGFAEQEPRQNCLPKSCTLPAGMSCYEFALDTDGNFHLDVGQALGTDITITAIACSETEYPPVPVALESQVTIPSGTHAQVTGGETGNVLNCCPQITENYCRAMISIRYHYAGNSTPHIVYGDVSGGFEELGSGGRP
jgi:hypothetical protein